MDDEEFEFFETAPRPGFCPYCGGLMLPDKYDNGSYNMGGIDDVDVFFGRCLHCDKIVDVAMDADNYDAETLAKFRKHGFMLERNESFLHFIYRHAYNRWQIRRGEFYARWLRPRLK